MPVPPQRVPGPEPCHSTVRLGFCAARPSTMIVNCPYCQHDIARSIPHRPQGRALQTRAAGQAPCDRQLPRGHGQEFAAKAVAKVLTCHTGWAEPVLNFRTQIRILSMVSNPVPDAAALVLVSPGKSAAPSLATPLYGYVSVVDGGGAGSSSGSTRSTVTAGTV